MNPQLLRLLMQQSDTTNKASDLSKQTLNEIFGNKSAEADSLQEDAIKRLQEGGLLGKQGRGLLDSLDTIPMMGENPTAELDSLQEDSVKRLQEGGTFGKQGRQLIDIIKKAFEQGSRMKTEQEAVLPSQRNRPGVQYV